MLEFYKDDRDKLSNLVYDIIKEGFDDRFICASLSEMILGDVMSYIQKYFNNTLYKLGKYEYEDIRQVVVKVIVQRLGGMV